MGGNCMDGNVIKERLAAPFPAEDIEWRVSRTFMQQSGPKAIVVAYLQNRAIMKRLDDVVGPENWENEFKPLHNGVLCGIRIHFSDTKSRIKWDGADITNIEPTKGGVSSAMKRAAVEWGIGRYIYGLSEVFVEIKKDKPSSDAIHVYQKAKGNTPEIKGYFAPPRLPKWALPEVDVKGQNDKQSASNRTTNVPENRNNQEVSNNQMRQLINHLNQMEPQLDLNSQPDFMVRIFNKANPNHQIRLPQEIRKAAFSEMKNYYDALRPVYDLIQIGVEHHCDKDTVLNYVNQLGHRDHYSGIFHLFFNISKNDVGTVLNKIKADYQSGQTA